MMRCQQAANGAIGVQAQEDALRQMEEMKFMYESQIADLEAKAGTPAREKDQQGGTTPAAAGKQSPVTCPLDAAPIVTCLIWRESS